ncbi:MAG: class I SAM-dependent methyltransferase [Proteobacteria bacterium]|nr:class I SAM-dependent methyltransferase [Pseudomonadota bacterium]
MIAELDIEVRDIDEWRTLSRHWPMLFSPEHGHALCDHVTRHGLVDPINGLVDPADIQIDSENYRESVLAEGIVTRHRAVLLLLQDALQKTPGSTRVYASEAVSPLARRLQAFLKDDFLGSEYLPTELDRKQHPNILHQDIHQLSFDNDSFDAYVSCDVLEHVPDLRKAVSEAARVLKPGGVFIGTVPFAPGRHDTIVRALMTDGRIEHIEEPQYHGNPTRPEEGSLVYQVPGWDFMDLCREVGFNDPCLRLILSRRHGVFAKGTSFVITFHAVCGDG